MIFIKPYNVTSFSPGIYFVVMQTEQGSRTKQFVKY